MFCLAVTEPLVLDGHTAEEVTKTELDIVFHAVSGVLSIPNPADIATLS